MTYVLPGRRRSALENQGVSLLDPLLPPGVERRPDALDLELDAPLALILVRRPLAFDLALAAHQTGSLLGAVLLFCHGGGGGRRGVGVGGWRRANTAGPLGRSVVAGGRSGSWRGHSRRGPEVARLLEITILGWQMHRVVSGAMQQRPYGMMVTKAQERR